MYTRHRATGIVLNSQQPEVDPSKRAADPVQENREDVNPNSNEEEKKVEEEKPMQANLIQLQPIEQDGGQKPSEDVGQSEKKEEHKPLFSNLFNNSKMGENSNIFGKKEEKGDNQTLFKSKINISE